VYSLAPLLQKDCDTAENKRVSDISDINVETAADGTCDASLREDATSVIAWRQSRGMMGSGTIKTRQNKRFQNIASVDSENFVAKIINLLQLNSSIWKVIWEVEASDVRDEGHERWWKRAISLINRQWQQRDLHLQHLLGFESDDDVKEVQKPPSFGKQI